MKHCGFTLSINPHLCNNSDEGAVSLQNPFLNKDVKKKKKKKNDVKDLKKKRKKIKLTNWKKRLPFIMGRVRTDTVNKAAKVIIENYYSRLTMDFHTNKRVCEEVANIPSKKLRNQIAGYVTHLMKRISDSPIRGISIKLQEDERERRDNYMPAVSAIEQDVTEVDPDTEEMLKMLQMNNIPGLQMNGNPREAR